jgi:hypothetical protein
LKISPLARTGSTQIDIGIGTGDGTPSPGDGDGWVGILDNLNTGIDRTSIAGIVNL